MFGTARRDRAFKDYCLVLQVHPEADAAMIDAAYWHLAKRYNQAAAYDSQAKAKLEELNEAYIVLGSAERREEYLKVRSRILGDALPEAPSLPGAAPPLAIMSRKRPQPVSEAAAEPAPTYRPRHEFVRTLVGAGLVAILGVAAAFWLPASLAFAPAMLGVLLGGVYFAVRRRRRAPGGPARHRYEVIPLPTTAGPPQGRERAARPAAAASSPSPTGGPSSSIDQGEIDRFRDHAERLRSVARSVVEDSAPTPGEAKQTGVDRATIEQIKRETQAPSKAAPGIDQGQVDRLRDHAERFRTVARSATESAAPSDGVAESDQQPVDRATIEQIKRETEALRRQGRPESR